MSVTIELKGMEQLTKRLETLDDSVKLEVRKALKKSALKVEGTAKIDIQRGAKTGEVYNRGGRLHQSSQEGQAPATDTGRLVGSITHNIMDSGLTAIVGSDVEYAIHLEFGTRHLGARPWLHPALEKSRKDIDGYFKQAVKNAVKKK